MSTTVQAVACPCGGRFQAPAQLAGRRVSCPACGKPIDVPALADSSLDAAALAMQSLPATNPLRRPAAAVSSAVARRPVPLGLWIGLGVGGAALVLVLVILLALWNAGQRLIAENMAKEKERQAARQAAGLAPEQPATKADGPQVYESPTGHFSVEFPGKPRREFVRNTELGGLSHWEAKFTVGDFSRGRGEQYLVTETIGSPKVKDGKIEAALTDLVNITAGVDVGRGRILTTTELTAPGQRGREVTYESQTRQGGRVSGRYRVLITDREIISLEWVAAPAKAEPAEVARFFDSFKLDAN